LGGGVQSREGLGIFLLTTASNTVLEPTKPPIQWVSGTFSLGVKRLGREADHSPPSSAEVKECVDLYFHSHSTPSWRGSQLKKSTGTTLPLALPYIFATTLSSMLLKQKLVSYYSSSVKWLDDWMTAGHEYEGSVCHLGVRIGCWSPGLTYYPMELFSENQSGRSLKLNYLSFNTEVRNVWRYLGT
jgi:hypothetical protein